MSKVADPLRELVGQMRDLDTVARTEQNALLVVADQIDREHERRMEQQSYDLRKAFCRYMGGVIDDYKHGHKRKSWVAQNKMQLELDVLKHKERMEQ